jgi:hypothetical protein
VTLDRDTWLLHRDQMELLHEIKSLLTVAHHERRAIRQEIRAMSEVMKSLKSSPKSTSLKDMFDATVWLRLGVVTILLVSGLGLVESLNIVKPF